MPEIRWNPLKSERLKKTRGASFEDILKGKLISVKRHAKKSHQSPVRGNPNAKSVVSF